MVSRPSPLCRSGSRGMSRMSMGMAAAVVGGQLDVRGQSAEWWSSLSSAPV